MNRLRPAVCTINWRKEKTLARILDIVRPFAFEGIELWEPHVSGALLSKIRESLKAQNMTPVCVSVPWGAGFWEDDEVLINQARDTGAQGIKVFGEIRDDWPGLVSKLKAFCQKANGAGLEVYIENHRNQPHDTIEKTMDLYKAASESNLKLIYDIYNIHEMGQSMLVALEKFGPHIHHLHVKWGKRDKEGKFVSLPLREAHPDFITVLKELSQTDMFCSLEMVDDPGMIEDNISFLKGGLS
jgi:3-dehydroshikimate dehydratase